MHNYFLGGLSRGFLRQFIDQAHLSLIVATALPQAQRLILADLGYLLHWLFCRNHVWVPSIYHFQWGLAAEDRRCIRIETYHFWSYRHCLCNVLQLTQPTLHLLFMTALHLSICCNFVAFWVILAAFHRQIIAIWFVWFTTALIAQLLLLVVKLQGSRFDNLLDLLNLPFIYLSRLFSFNECDIFVFTFFNHS
jgi:hypothetical protein